MNAPNPDRAAKDAAYAERNRLVALLAALFPGSLEENAAGSPEDRAEGWNWIVYVELPTGQASWHLHDRELPLFAHVPRNQGRAWDGHTTEEKYARVERLAAQMYSHAQIFFPDAEAVFAGRLPHPDILRVQRVTEALRAHLAEAPSGVVSWQWQEVEYSYGATPADKLVIRASRLPRHGWRRAARPPVEPAEIGDA